MIGIGPRSIKFEYSKKEEVRTDSPKLMSYTFHVPITPSSYKATPFNYQAMNHAATVGGLIRSSKIYEPSGKGVAKEVAKHNNKEEKKR